MNKLKTKVAEFYYKKVPLLDNWRFWACWFVVVGLLKVVFQ